MEYNFPKLSDEERKQKLDIPAGKIHLVIDTDAKNEVDDQFAVSWALKSPDRFIVDAVYAAPFSHGCFTKLMPPGASLESAGGITLTTTPGDGMEASYQELLKLFELLGESTEGRVFRGSKEYISDIGGLIESEAANDLVKRAMSSDETIYVATIGAPTNIASALLMEPELVKKIVVIWLGAQPPYFRHGIEFNAMQDVKATQILFDSGVPLVLIPCMNVASMLTLSKPEVEQLLIGKSDIANYLAEIVLEALSDDASAANYMAAMMRHTYLAGQEDREDSYLFQFKTNQVAPSRIIWDISTIAFLKNPSWTLSKLEDSPVYEDDMSWGPKYDERHKIRVVNYCSRDPIFGDMIACLTK
ncbi:MAG: nucleoside hydrolase [Oscillospiraceae bacterium]|nr:nucleoside hydrolase [Oscillospiraceae bacterium]